MPNIDILVVEDDASSQAALRQVLDSEGWQVQIVPSADGVLQELAARAWTIVIANVNLTGFSTPLYATLRELALAPALESGKARLRVLFVVPENADAQARPILESARLPYVTKPFHLHDFLESVSDLLLENEAISEPIRHVRQDRRKFPGRGSTLGRDGGRSQSTRRNTGMFADYSEYVMTEEEIAEYEKQEAEERERKKRKKTHPDSL